MINWVEVEALIGEKLPNCLKWVLNSCGYEMISSLCALNIERVREMENFINEHRINQIREFECSHSEYYKEREDFSFLPGHVTILLTLPKYVETNPNKIRHLPGSDRYSFILNELIKTAEKNLDTNRASYSDNIRYFATYVFLLCGRSCMLRNATHEFAHFFRQDSV